MWRRRLADFGMLATEATALFVLGATLSSGTDGHRLSFVTVLLAMLGGFYLVRFLINFDTGVPALISAGIAASVLALLVLLNLQFAPSAGPLSLGWLGRLAADPEGALAGRSAVVYGVLIVAFAWGRAVTLAQRELSYQGAMASFTVGLVLVLTLLAIGQGMQAARTINAAALPYLLFGLLTLSMVQLSRAQYHQGDMLRGPWVATLAGTVGLLALISAAIGLFPLGLLNTLLAPVGALALQALDLIILVIALPLAFLVQWIIGMIHGNKPWEIQAQDPAAGSLVEDLQRRAAEGGPPAFLAFLVKVLFLAALAALVGYILWRTFRRLRRPLTDDDETRESLEQEGGLGADLGALFGGLLGRFRRAPRPDREPDLPAGALAVRRLYVRALRRAEGSGVRRPEASTPAEFAPALAETLHAPSAVTLSDRFAAARYGRVVPSPDEIAALDREVR